MLSGSHVWFGHCMFACLFCVAAWRGGLVAAGRNRRLPVWSPHTDSLGRLPVLMQAPAIITSCVYIELARGTRARDGEVSSWPPLFTPSIVLFLSCVLRPKSSCLLGRPTDQPIHQAFRGTSSWRMSRFVSLPVRKYTPLPVHMNCNTSMSYWHFDEERIVIYPWKGKEAWRWHGENMCNNSSMNCRWLEFYMFEKDKQMWWFDKRCFCWLVGIRQQSSLRPVPADVLSSWRQCFWPVLGFDRWRPDWGGGEIAAFLTCMWF